MDSRCGHTRTFPQSSPYGKRLGWVRSGFCYGQQPQLPMGKEASVTSPKCPTLIGFMPDEILTVFRHDVRTVLVQLLFFR